MKKIILALTLIQFTTPLFAQNKANEKFFCALPRALQYKDQVINMKGTDKTKHCSISCIIALECSAFETYLFGLSKEIYDGLGGGTPDQQDIVANKKGIELARSRQALDEFDCMEMCFEIYPK